MAKQDILDRIRTDRRDLLHMDRLKKGIVERGLDGLVALSPINVTYTGGVLMPTMQPFRLFTFVVTSADGNQGVVINEADAYFFREYSWIEEVRPFRYVETTVKGNKQAVAMLADILRDMNLSGSKLGIEKTSLSMLYWEDLAEQAPETEFVDASDVLEYARLVKTPTEIEVFSLAAYYTDKAIASAFALAKPGDSEKTVASSIQTNLLRLGADALGCKTHLHAGVHSTVVHAWPTETKRLESGEVIHVDTGAMFGGYKTDVSRNAVVESASARQESIYRHLWEIEQLVFESIRPGVLAGELWDISQEAFKKAGLVYPWGTLGHSIGLMGHEGFEIVSGSDQLLEAGMILSIEPSHIEKGDARYHIEDNVLVTEDGMELLSNYMDAKRMFVIQ